MEPEHVNCNSFKGVFHEYGDFRDIRGGLNSIGNPLLFEKDSVIAFKGLINNGRIDISYSNFQMPDSFSYD